MTHIYYYKLKEVSQNKELPHSHLIRTDGVHFIMKKDLQAHNSWEEAPVNSWPQADKWPKMITNIKENVAVWERLDILLQLLTKEPRTNGAIHPDNVESQGSARNLGC